MFQLEKDLEKFLTKKIKVLNGKAFKWVSPGCSGVPDRIVILPGPKIAFIELKQEGRTNGESARQKKIITWLVQMGCRAECINSQERLNAFLEELAYE